MTTPELRVQERSIGELLGQLSQDMSLLVRQEAQLAKVEIEEKLSRVARDTVALAAGGMVAYLGALALVAALILVLAQLVGIRAWLAAFLVGAVLAIAGFVMLRRGLTDLKRVDPTPRRTVQNIKEDIALVREEHP